MTGVDWRIKGVSLTSCNCDVGCPCQFNSLPTHGHCRATMGARIDQGHFGDVKLDGLTFAVLVAWPGPIHEGKGEAQPVVDSSATPAQREAILAIIAGEHTDPGATIFNVFAATFDKIHDPIFAPVDLACDLKSRTGHIRVPGVLDMSCEPIRNPITGAEHRARIEIPDGFEYNVAEIAAGRTKSGKGASVDLEWSGAHAHLIDLHWTQHGVVR
jgi:hypothetical protein